MRGTALTVSSMPYPMEQPTTVWISPATAARLAGTIDGGGYVIEMRLANPDQAESFAAAHPEVIQAPGRTARANSPRWTRPFV